MSVAAPSIAGAAVARVVSLALGAPSAQTLSVLERLTAALGTETLDPAVADAVTAVAQALAATPPLDDLRSEHEALFGTEGACPPYEGAFERDPFRETRTMADVAGFYLAFGSEPDGPQVDRHDHVGCELEFLAFLGARRLEAVAAGDDEAAETCRLAEDAFLQDHVGRVLPALCGEVAAIATAPLHRAAARLGAAWVEAELRSRGLVARPAGERRRRGPVEDDQLVCGDTCGLAAEQALHRLQPRLRAPPAGSRDTGAGG